MKATELVLVLAALLGRAAAAGGFRFVESSDELGLSRPLAGVMAHAAACGDIDGDGDLDLYVGTFCDRPAERYLGRAGPVPNMLLVNERGSYKLAEDRIETFAARTSGALLVDLDNDGDLDLYVSTNSKAGGLRRPNKLYENIGGRFRDVSAGNGACVAMGGRSVAALDFDADGLLDLLVAEDKWTGGRTRLFRNLGRLRFEDASAGAGLPGDLPGLGVVACDFNGDLWSDIFVAQANRLFLAAGRGRFVEGDSSVFQYAPLNAEDTPCGVACGDLNRDGRTDLVIVDHGQPARQHLFLNLGTAGGTPRFVEATARAGLDYRFPCWTPQKLHLKHAHVEIGDFDNDGLAEILVAATYRHGGADQPFICRNVTPAGERYPRFEVPPLEKANAYFAAGPSADYDGDGRLDVFLASWFPQIGSKMLLNRTEAGHWLGVRVIGRTVNRMGIGSKVRLYRPGQLGRAEALLGCGQIGIGRGFCSGQQAVAHFGLGELTSCDLEVRLPHGRGTITRTNVKADHVIVVQEGL